MFIVPGEIHGQHHPNTCHKFCSSSQVVGATKIKGQTLHICVAYYNDKLHFTKCVSKLKSNFSMCHVFYGCEKLGLEIVLQAVVRTGYLYYATGFYWNLLALLVLCECTVYAIKEKMLPVS
jgi:hypothetical protein